MLDLVIRGGVVIDGTGAPRRAVDIGIRDGRIAQIGSIDGAGARDVDAAGHVVCPGFIDIHTHYDAQVLWDPTVSPSPLHGVTTVVGGNCGISLGPVKPEDRDFLSRLLSRVEAIPLESLAQGFDFAWETFPEFLDAVEQRGAAINIGFLVGHAAIRRWVMGAGASEREATAAEIEAMQALVHEALSAGALGFSSSTASTQLDGDGRPTPPQFAATEEFIALAGCCRDHPGTSVEFIPGSASYGFDPDGSDVALIAGMSRASQRPVNWNTVLLSYPGIPDIQDKQLDASDAVSAAGGFAVPMIIPHNFRVRTDFVDSDVGFRSLPSFEPLFALPRESRLAALSDRAFRKRLLADLPDVPPGPNRMFLESLSRHAVSDVGPPDLQHLVGRPLTDLAAERGTSVIDTMLDIACEAGLDIGFEHRLVPIATPEERALRRRVLRDPRLMLGASDGGAHVRGVINVEYPTASFEELVRDDDIFTLEELIQEFTDVPARLYGLTDRGRIEVGAWADLVIFDPDTIGASPVEMRRDLPGGAPRLYNHGLGIDAVFVAGEEIVREDEFTGRRAGRVLRGGRDTLDTGWDSLLQRRREPR